VLYNFRHVSWRRAFCKEMVFRQRSLLQTPALLTVMFTAGNFVLTNFSSAVGIQYFFNKSS
ncbi:MAG: hypothetical protein CVU53_06780, partial [Deltaproteobacteria bacterium HGW-Deltaproteobacteria-11]